MSHISTRARVLAITAMSIFSFIALVTAAEARTNRQAYVEARIAVIKKHGAEAAGRDIRKGLRIVSSRGHVRIKRASWQDYRRVKRTLKALLAPAPYRPLLVRAAAPPAQPPAGVQSPTVMPAPGGQLQSIAACESSNNPSAVSADGQYTGLFQFDDATWSSVGGSGRAGNAPAAEQYMRAAKLYAQRGGAPWPVCSRR